MRSPRALLFTVALAAFGVSGVLLLAAFVVPERPITMREVDFGAVGAFAPGFVTTYRLTDDLDGPVRLREDAPHTQHCVRDAGGVYVHIVRLEDGTFRALDARSPHLGEILPWLPEFEYNGQRGWFRDHCHGETFAMDDTRVFGPSPRDMDRYDVRVVEGRLAVDLRRLREGERPPRRANGTPTPASGTPWPTALATQSPG